MGNMWRTLGTIALIVVLGVLVSVLQLVSNPDSGHMWLEHAKVQGPMAKIVSWTVDSVHSWAKAPQLARQNVSLLEENQRLQNELVSLEALRKENEELRAMLKLQSGKPKKYLAADVISRDPQDWFAQIVIGKGSAEGVTDNMVAVASGNLVGKVSEIREHSSLVQLITDERVIVPVKLEKNGATGIMYGQSGRYCRGRYFHRDIKIEPHAVVMTSGLGDIYPAGIVVGHVVAGALVHESLFQEINIRPTIDLTALHRVSLVQK